MKEREQPKETWAHHLLPLLNHSCKTAVNSLPLDSRYSYKTISELILNTCQQGSRYPGQELLEGGVKHGETLRAMVIRLGKLASRYAPEDDATVVRDKFVLEIFLKSLPKEVAKYVREKEPTSACQAADLASKYMAREGMDECHYSTPKTYASHTETEPLTKVTPGAETAEDSTSKEVLIGSVIHQVQAT